MFDGALNHPLLAFYFFKQMRLPAFEIHTCNSDNLLVFWEGRLLQLAP